MLPQFFALNVFFIMAVGLITSYTDLKQGLIRNMIIFPAIAIAFLLNFMNGLDFWGFLLNGFLAFLFGFILWFAALWSAADSKLFITFALLFPLTLYPKGFSYFPAFSILLFSFIPIFVLMFFLVILRTTRKQKLEAFKRTFNARTVASVAVFLFSFGWIVYHLFALFAVELDIFVTTIIIFILVSAAEFFLPKKTNYFFAFLSLIFLALHFWEVVQIDFVLLFILWLALFLVLVFFVVRLGFFAFGKKIMLKDLKPGMVLLDSVIEKEDILKRVESFYPSLVNIFLGAKEKKLIPSGKALTASQIKMLHQKHKTHKAHFDMLLVQETLPFAAILFVGVILTLAAAILYPA